MRNKTLSSVKLSSELSERITILRLPLIIGVVFLHSYDTMIGRGTQLHYSGWVKFVCDYVSEGVATVSVPLLFLISGYLFYHGLELSRTGFVSRIAKRGRTLLIPYLAWNVLCLFLTLIAQSLPATLSYVSGRSALIASFSLFDYLNAILGVTTHPIAYQFWFVRDLFLLVLLSPLLYVVLTKAAMPFLGAVALWWAASNVWSLPVLSRESILFFSLGALIAITQIDPLGIDKFGMLSLVYLPLSILDALTKGLSFNNPIHKIAELCGIAFVCCATKYVVRWSTCRNVLITLSSASFFVFATHEPLLTVTRKLSYQLFRSSNDMVIVSLYFADAIGVISVCISAYYLCRWTAPEMTKLMTGGR